MKLKEEAKRHGLVVNERKAKYMKCGRRKTMKINWKYKQWNLKRFNPSNI
jgi:hypothetical protein